MKNALLFVLMTLCAALPFEAVNAATGTDATAQQNERTSSQSADHGRPAKKNKPHGSAVAPKPNHSQPLPKNQKGSTPQKLTGTQPATPRASGMPITNKTANNARFTRPPKTSRAPIPTSNNVRHRGPNPATLGGSTSLCAANAGSLNGAHIARKP
jgi:hypothetical protein